MRASPTCAASATCRALRNSPSSTSPCRRRPEAPDRFPTMSPASQSRASAINKRRGAAPSAAPPAQGMKGKRLSPISPVPVSDVYRPGATGLCRITAPRKEQLQPFAGLEGPDLVPEERRELEIQIVRGRFHFTLLILDERGQVLAGPGHRLHFQLKHVFHVRQDVPDRLLYGARRDAVLPVVCELDLAAAPCFPDRVPDGPGYDVRIDQHFAGHVPGRPADGLDERGLAPQKTFLVGVQDGDERNLRQIQAFPKQVHA